MFRPVPKGNQVTVRITVGKFSPGRHHKVNAKMTDEGTEARRPVALHVKDRDFANGSAARRRLPLQLVLVSSKAAHGWAQAPTRSIAPDQQLFAHCA